MDARPAHNNHLVIAVVALIMLLVGFGAAWALKPTAMTVMSTSSNTITDSTAIKGDQAVASTTNGTLGLEITLTLNSTHIIAGDSINATLSYRNILPRALNLSALTEDWRLTALGDDGDDYGYCVGVAPFVIQVFGGHFTESNITLGAPLNADLKDALTGCGFFVPPYHVFQPLESGPAAIDITSGYNIQGNLLTFQPGAYTVVAGDRWGQMVILNFVVEQAVS